jgi:hypothetical protein
MVTGTKETGITSVAGLQVQQRVSFLSVTLLISHCRDEVVSQRVRQQRWAQGAENGRGL